MLEFRDARIYGKPGEVSAFSVRVTNNHAVCGATRIKVRIDFFGKDGKAIDGREIVLDGTVPSGNTRLIGEPYVGITGLPERDGWTWTYTVVDAAASSLWCGSWFGMEP